MQHTLLEIIRCPVTRSRLTLQEIKTGSGVGAEQPVTVEEGILFAEQDWFYPVINGIPRLCVEAFLDYPGFLQQHLPNYATRKNHLLEVYGDLLRYVIKKNKRTRESFSKEWSVYNFEKDNTWNADDAGMIECFLAETNETTGSIKGKIIFDAGCGNGKLNCLLAEAGITNIAMDFSNSIELPHRHNQSTHVHFIQGDVQFPPVAFEYFDIVHCSGVLIHTNNTELSFSCLVPAVKPGGKLSVWLYHPRDNKLHRLFNAIRRFSSKLPLSFQYYLYAVTIFPVSYIVKKIKGNPQNNREMMVDILDWFTPEFRWEHGHREVSAWYYKRQFKNVKVTTSGVFGFNSVGEKDGSL